ncbi:putative transmembrane protein TauE [Plasmopara halstedii]
MKIALLISGSLVTLCVAQNAQVFETRGLHCYQNSDCGYLPALSCISGKCDFCRPGSNDCSADGSKRCQVKIRRKTTGLQTPYAHNLTGENVQIAYCTEKNLFEPFTWKDVVATIIALLSTALGSGCGVGGGGLLVPLYICFYGLSPKHAIPLSKATIFGNALSSYFYNFYRMHPADARLPLINYQVASIMEPTTLIGTIFGVMMNHIFPDWLILVLLISLLSFITHKTFVRGNKLHEKEANQQLAVFKSATKCGLDDEKRGHQWLIYRTFDAEIAARRWLEKTRSNKKLREIKAQDHADFKSLPPLHQHQLSSSDALLSGLDQHDFGTFDLDDDEMLQKRKVIEQCERKKFPLKYVIPMVISWLVVLVQSMLRGGHGTSSVVGVICNSTKFWILTFLPLLVPISITLWVGHQLRLQNRLKVMWNYPFIEGEIHWIKKRIIVFPALCSLAGMCAGLLGIGGGMVKGPIMLEMGILPPVQSATASFMILFTSSSTTLQFAINGQFPGERQYDYIMWFAFMGCIGGFCGQSIVALLVKKYKRESIMVYLLAMMIGSSALAMSIIGLKSTIQDFQKHMHLGFNDICDHE